MKSSMLSKSSRKTQKALSPTRSFASLASISSNSSTTTKKTHRLNNESQNCPRETSTYRRSSLFNSPDSPCARRRSFLSKAMIKNEHYVVYRITGSSSHFCQMHDNYDYSDDDENMRIDVDGGQDCNELNCTCSLAPRFSVSLNESQGFNWNQDLFVTRYQQRQGVIYSDSAVADDEDDVAMRLPRSNVFSYSLSREQGDTNTVDVIEIKLTEEELNVGS